MGFNLLQSNQTLSSTGALVYEQELIKSTILVLLTPPWCSPCRRRYFWLYFLTSHSLWMNTTHHSFLHLIRASNFKTHNWILFFWLWGLNPKLFVWMHKLHLDQIIQYLGYQWVSPLELQVKKNSEIWSTCRLEEWSSLFWMKLITHVSKTRRIVSLVVHCYTYTNLPILQAWAVKRYAKFVSAMDAIREFLVYCYQTNKGSIPFFLLYLFYTFYSHFLFKSFFLVPLKGSSVWVAGGGWYRIGALMKFTTIFNPLG